MHKMIFRVTDKISRKIKTGPLIILPPDSNPYADWAARLFTCNRCQYILITNTTSLYSMILYGRGIPDEHSFINEVLRSMREFLTSQGHECIWDRFIAPHLTEIAFSRAFSRQVTGSMNDIEFQAKVTMHYHGVSPHELSVRLNEVPFTMLPGFARPCDVFPKMIASNQ